MIDKDINKTQLCESADFDDISIRDEVKKILGRSVNVSNSYLGIFEPEK